MAAGAVAMVTRGSEVGRSLAVNGAVLQMVSHGLITGSLFLFAGVLWRRAGTFEIGAFGGLVQRAPVFAGAMSLDPRQPRAHPLRAPARARHAGLAPALVGVPPLAGFVGKFALFAATMQAGYTWLMVLGLINSALSLFYAIGSIVLGLGAFLLLGNSGTVELAS